MSKHINDVIHDKLGIFTYAGYDAKSGWDTAIPQTIFDTLLSWGVPNVNAFFVMDCKSSPWALHHMGEALYDILGARTKANEEVFHQLYVTAQSNIATRQDKQLFDFICGSPGNCMLDNSSAGFLDLNMIIATYHNAWIESRRALVNEINEARRGCTNPERAAIVTQDVLEKIAPIY